MGDSTGYDFCVIKLKIYFTNNNQREEFSGEQTNEEADFYIKTIRKDRIKESIFCYWNLLYDEKFKSYEESEFTSIISKVKITETENESYKHSVLLEILDNKWGILEHGTTIHLVKIAKYLYDKTIKKSNLTAEWKKYVEADNEDVLLIGIVHK